MRLQNVLHTCFGSFAGIRENLVGRGLVSRSTLMHMELKVGMIRLIDQSALVTQVSRKSIAAVCYRANDAFFQQGTSGEHSLKFHLQFAKEPALLSNGGRWMAARIGKRRLDVCQWRVLDQPVAPFAGQPPTFLCSGCFRLTPPCFLLFLFNFVTPNELVVCFASTGRFPSFAVQLMTDRIRVSKSKVTGEIVFPPCF